METMIAREISSGVWHVVAENDAEATSMRWLFTMQVKSPPEEVSPRLGFDDFLAMRVSAATHWEKVRAEGIEGQIFDAIEDVRRQTLGLSCRHTGQEWHITLKALREDRSRWVQLMTTPQRRALFASHPNFAAWVRGSDPQAVVDGIKLNLETSSFETV